MHWDGGLGAVGVRRPRWEIVHVFTSSVRENGSSIECARTSKHFKQGQAAGSGVYLPLDLLTDWSDGDV